MWRPCAFARRPRRNFGTSKGRKGDGNGTPRQATRDYVEQPILLNGELATIRAEVQINHNAEMGQWTYPGCRADVVKALNTTLFHLKSDATGRNDELNGSPADGVREAAPKRGVFRVEVCSVERWLRLS